MTSFHRKPALRNVKFNSGPASNDKSISQEIIQQFAKITKHGEFTFSNV